MMNSAEPPRPKKPKIGEGHASAMLRQGFKELQAAMYTGSNVAREPEPGTFGTPTHGEIAADRKPGTEPSMVDRHGQRARSERSKQPDRDPPEPER
ncbi:MAG: hypothetical protein QM783_15815 [Phycisphaerales bacterium]